MTELQFLIDLLLNHKLRPDTKKHVAERIGHVEDKMYKPNVIVPSAPLLPKTLQQSASTQAILDRDPSLDVSNQTIMVAPVAPTPAKAFAINRIVGGEVNTGRGSKGPRKF